MLGTFPSNCWSKVDDSFQWGEIAAVDNIVPIHDRRDRRKGALVIVEFRLMDENQQRFNLIYETTVKTVSIRTTDDADRDKDIRVRVLSLNSAQSVLVVRLFDSP